MQVEFGKNTRDFFKDNQNHMSPNKTVLFKVFYQIAQETMVFW